MGECGCAFEVLRCNAHRDDMVIVLEPQEAASLDEALAYAMHHAPAGDRAAHTGNWDSIRRDIGRGGVPKEYDLDVAGVAEWLADDPGRTDELVHRLALGGWDEWDCDIVTLLDNFGPQEWAIALRAGSRVRFANPSDDHGEDPCTQSTSDGS